MIHVFILSFIDKMTNYKKYSVFVFCYFCCCCFRCFTCCTNIAKNHTHKNGRFQIKWASQSCTIYTDHSISCFVNDYYKKQKVSTECTICATEELKLHITMVMAGIIVCWGEYVYNYDIKIVFYTCIQNNIFS